MLARLIVNVNTAKVLEHFVLHERWEQNKKDLCEILEIYPKEMGEILDRLIAWGLITVTRTIARTKFYRVNKKSKLLNPLRVLIQEVSFKESLRVTEIC